MKLTSFSIKDFPLDLYRRFKAYCANKGITIKEGLVRAMDKLLED